MYYNNRLFKVFKSAEKIHFDDSSKIVIMSDCHRGSGNRSDNFLSNKSIYNAALSYYYNNNYTYIELGDGDELWENSNFQDIIRVHSDVFIKLSRFYKKGRLYFIHGNHDMVKKDPVFVKDNMYYFIKELNGRLVSLFKNITIHEGLILKHRYNEYEIFLTHGHQADISNDKFWRLNRFLVKYLWRNLELISLKDFTSAAKNYKKQKTVGKRLVEWANKNKKFIIAGHTHRPTFPDIGEPTYFNTGSCVHPHCITVIEITRGKIALVKWHIKTRNNGVLFADREIIAGPRKLSDYFKIL